MDYPNPEVHNQLLCHNSKRIIKRLLSFSLFCILLSLLPLLLQSFKPFLMQFFSTYIVGKSYMFLFCNGLLAFIVMNSGLMKPSSPSTHQSIQVAVDNETSSQLEFNVSEIAAPVADENVMEIESPEEEEKCLNLMIVEQEIVHSNTQEEEDEEEHEHGAEDTEELNKKCEDFIRKMKAAFCSEPRADYSFYFNNQKALVAVN